MVPDWLMDSPSFAHVPDWSRGCIRGVQGVVKPETGFKILDCSGNPAPKLANVFIRAYSAAHSAAYSVPVSPCHEASAASRSASAAACPAECTASCASTRAVLLQQPSQHATPQPWHSTLALEVHNLNHVYEAGAGLERATVGPLCVNQTTSAVLLGWCRDVSD